MLEAATNHTIISEASEELIGNEPWTIEVYADGLMDEIFTDVENSLQGKGELNFQTSRSQFKQKSTVKSSPIVNPQTPREIKAVNSHIPQEKTQVVANNRVANNKATSSQTTSDGESNLPHNLPQKSRHTWGKLIPVIISFGLVIAGLTWLIYSGLVNHIFSHIFAEELNSELASTQIQEQSSEKVDPQAELVSYMLGALAAIDEEPQDKSINNVMMSSMNGDYPQIPMTQMMSGNPPGSNLPPVRDANNLQPIPRRSTKVVQRVYIPVYQAPPPMRYTPPSVANASPGKLPPIKQVAYKTYSEPFKTNGGKAAKNTVPTANLALMKAELKPVEMGNQPIAVGAAPQPKPAVPPQLSNGKAPTDNNTSVNNASVQPQEVAVAPTKPSHELLGVMDLGEKSAALFKIDGITRRIHKGENIGSSGWTLVDVSDNEIIVRRNGEVRSIQTGQKI